MTDKTMSVQVYIFSFEQNIRSRCGLVVKAFVLHRQGRGPGFESRYLQNLIFEILNSLEVLGHHGQYIDTLDMKFHQPLWVSGHVGQSFELIVMGSNPDSEISGGRGGRPRNSLVAG